MPGFNGMGPNNDGPGTGRGLGTCGGGNDSNNMIYGRGRGGAGCGRGMGKRNWRGSSGNFSPSGDLNISNNNTPESLKSQKDFLTLRLQEIEKKLSQCTTEK